MINLRIDGINNAGQGARFSGQIHLVEQTGQFVGDLTYGGKIESKVIGSLFEEWKKP